MIKLLWRFFLLVLLAAGFAWIADRPGTLTIRWLGREINMSFIAGIVVAVLAVGAFLQRLELLLMDQCLLTERGRHQHLRLLTLCHLLLQRHLATLSPHLPQLAQIFEFRQLLLGDDKCGLRVSRLCLYLAIRGRG